MNHSIRTQMVKVTYREKGFVKSRLFNYIAEAEEFIDGMMKVKWAEPIAVRDNRSSKYRKRDYGCLRVDKFTSDKPVKDWI